MKEYKELVEEAKLVGGSDSSRREGSISQLKWCLGTKSTGRERYMAL